MQILLELRSNSSSRGLERIMMFSLVFTCFLFGSVAAERLLTSSELTKKLSKIFKTYDKRIVPSLEGDPVNISMQLYISNMVPSERYHMHYEIQVFIRQIWTDYRLNISTGNAPWNAFGIDMFNDIWIPEVHFPSAKKGKWHSLMRKTTALHIHREGMIYLSRGVSLTLYCPMDLSNFPFDSQECKMDIRLYAFNNEHCRLHWNYAKGGPIFLADPLEISEFTLKKLSFKKEIDDLSAAGSFDTLSLTFTLARRKSYYLVNFMLPTGMIVIMSWVGFWIDYRATPARCSLAITTVLTITTLTNSIRASLPQVGHIKSIDVYLLSCFFFVFASTIEFAITGVTDRRWLKLYERRKENGEVKKKNKKTKETKSHSRTSDENSNETSKECELNEISLTITNSLHVEDTVQTHRRKGKFQVSEEKNEEKSSQTQKSRKVCFKRYWHAFVEKLIEKHYNARREAHIIDKLSRGLFPVAFVIFNAAYFITVFFLA